MSQEIVSQVRAALSPRDSHVSFAITLMEHLVVPTFVLDAERRVLIWNKACERLTGVRAEEVIGTRNHWLAFYDAARPCLADLVAGSDYAAIAKLYSVHENPEEPSFGVHAENWCVMPRRGRCLYLAVDAGPVFDDAGHLIAVVETLRDITEKQLAQSKVIEQAGILKAHYDQHLRETELARRILDHQIRADLMQQAGVDYSVTPAANFSGDMVLAARSPDGRLYAVLADATGHGLAAAVSVLPMVQEFYRLVGEGRPLIAIVESINFLLANSLPLGRFVAAAVLCLDQAVGEGEIWVGGVPDVLMVGDDGTIVEHFPSLNLPLGISPENTAIGKLEAVRWKAHARVLLLSDGVIEAAAPDGEPFGESRLAGALAGRKTGQQLIDALHAALQRHLQGAVAHDDMSLLVVDCPAVAAGD